MRDEYEVTDQGGLVLLETAARCWARRESARKVIEKHGVVVIDRFGQTKANPACAVERDATSGLLAALRQLHLDVEPLTGRR